MLLLCYLLIIFVDSKILYVDQVNGNGTNCTEMNPCMLKTALNSTITNISDDSTIVFTGPNIQVLNQTFILSNRLNFTSHNKIELIFTQSGSIFSCAGGLDGVFFSNLKLVDIGSSTFFANSNWDDMNYRFENVEFINFEGNFGYGRSIIVNNCIFRKAHIYFHKHDINYFFTEITNSEFYNINQTSYSIYVYTRQSRSSNSNYFTIENCTFWSSKVFNFNWDKYHSANTGIPGDIKIKNVDIIFEPMIPYVDYYDSLMRLDIFGHSIVEFNNINVKLNSDFFTFPFYFKYTDRSGYVSQINFRNVTIEGQMPVHIYGPYNGAMIYGRMGEKVDINIYDTHINVTGCHQRPKNQLCYLWQIHQYIKPNTVSLNFYNYSQISHHFLIKNGETWDKYLGYDSIFFSGGQDGEANNKEITFSNSYVEFYCNLIYINSYNSHSIEFYNSTLIGPRGRDVDIEFNEVDGTYQYYIINKDSRIESLKYIYKEYNFLDMFQNNGLYSLFLSFKCNTAPCDGEVKFIDSNISNIFSLNDEHHGIFYIGYPSSNEYQNFKVESIGTKWSKNVGVNGGVFKFRDNKITSIVIENSIFEENVALENGGAIYSIEQRVDITNSKFIRNIALYEGGALFFFHGTVGYLTSCEFIGNRILFEDDQRNTGGAILIHGDNKRKKVEYKNDYYQFVSNIFENNFAKGNGGDISISHTSVVFQGYNHFKGSIAQQNGGSIFANRFILNVDDTTIFQDSKSLNGGCLYLTDGEIFIIEDIMNGNQIFKVENCEAEQDGGGIYFKNTEYESESSHITFKGNKASYRGGAIYTINSKIVFGNYRFYSDINSIALSSHKVVECNDTGVFIDVITGDGYSEMSGGIYLWPDFNITNLDHICPGDGGCGSSRKAGNINFKMNEAVFGGVISSASSYLTFTTATYKRYGKSIIIDNNTAIFGGVFHLSGGDEIYTIDHLNIKNNHAKYGSIFAINANPDTSYFTDGADPGINPCFHIYDNNTALYHGQDIVYLNDDYTFNFSSIINYDKFKNCDKEDGCNDSTFLPKYIVQYDGTNIYTEEMINNRNKTIEMIPNLEFPLRFQIISKEMKIFPELYDSFRVKISFEKQESCEDVAVVLKGSDEIGLNQDGIIEFNGITLIGSFDCSVKVKLKANEFNLSLDFLIFITQCGIGFTTNIGENSCVPCLKNTYKLTVGDYPCRSCPIGNICSEKSTITVLPGFYSIYKTGDNGEIQIKTTECETSEICIGGVVNSTSTSLIGETQKNVFFSNDCGNDRKGPLCKLCVENYSSFNGDCIRCDNGFGYFVPFLRFIIWEIILLLFLHYSSQSGKSKEDKSGSASMRILTSYIQTLFLVISFSKWYNSSEIRDIVEYFKGFFSSLKFFKNVFNLQVDSLYIDIPDDFDILNWNKCAFNLSNYSAFFWESVQPFLQIFSIFIILIILIIINSEIFKKLFNFINKKNKVSEKNLNDIEMKNIKTVTKEKEKIGEKKKDFEEKEKGKVLIYKIQEINPIKEEDEKEKKEEGEEKKEVKKEDDEKEKKEGGEKKEVKKEDDEKEKKKEKKTTIIIKKGIKTGFDFIKNYIQNMWIKFRKSLTVSGAVMTLVNVIIVSQMPIILTSLKIFFCNDDIDQDSKVLLDFPGIKCNDLSYFLWLFLWYIPLLVITICIPIIITIYLIYKRKELYKKDSFVYKYFYNGMYSLYKPEYYWYEIVQTSRKVILIIISTYKTVATNDNTDLSGLSHYLNVIALSIFIVFQVSFMPYKRRIENVFESVSIFVIIMIVGIQEEQYSAIKDLSMFTAIIITILMFLAFVIWILLENKFVQNILQKCWNKVIKKNKKLEKIRNNIFINKKNIKKGNDEKGEVIVIEEN